MTIRITPKKATTIPVHAPNKFTLQDIENLFHQNYNWNKFYKYNIEKFNRADPYEWPVFPLLKMNGKFHKCVLHPTVDVDGGNKQHTFIWENINFSQFVFHCMFYKPEEHKKYIIEKLLTS